MPRVKSPIGEDSENGAVRNRGDCIVVLTLDFIRGEKPV